MTRDEFDNILETDLIDGWVNLSGCNSCINQSICKAHGSCIILYTQDVAPIYTKKKRRVLGRLKEFGECTPDRLKLVYKQIHKISNTVHYKELEAKQEKEPKINLTVFEKMCIEQIKKPR